MFRRDRAHLSFATVGIPGAVGALLLLTWLVGWALFGAHAGGWHLLVPVGLALVLLQGVLRGNDEDDES